MYIDPEKYERFNTLWEKYHVIVWMMCLDYAHGKIHYGHDFSQEVAIRLWEHLDELHSNAGTFGELRWVRRVTASTLKLHSHKAKIDLEKLSEELLAEAATANSDDRETLEMLMAYLPERDREMLAMHLDGYDIKSIAECYNTTESGIRQHLYRIKKKLKEINDKINANEKQSKR